MATKLTLRTKLKLLYKFLYSLPNTIYRVDAELRNIPLPPIERHVFLHAAFNRAGLFDSSYDEWRITRIDKLLEVFGIEYFKDLNILELGSGHGDIGAFFAELGAKVLCLDGRTQNVIFANLKHRKVPNFKCLQFNLENDFTEFGHFDLIINFGLLYHLKNPEAHLDWCFKMSDDIFLETVVCDSTDPYKIFYCDENINKDEEALEGIGCRPSPFYVERLANENNFEAIRYFSADLNVRDQFVYDWVHRNDNRLGEDWKLRRCWRLKKIKR
jgi:SAM-dependent methyltransferase